MAIQKNKNILAQGAEAIIYLENSLLVKERISKNYRLPELDDKLRTSRTRKEKKILEKAKKIINVPNVIHSSEQTKIYMEYLDGEKLSNTLSEYGSKNKREIMKSVGKQVARLHNEDIIHGDLTTSNMILSRGKVYLIDFGLGFISKRIEDKAVDMHLIKRALEAKHYLDYEKLFGYFIEGYTESKEFEKIINQLKKVESRGRYKKEF